MWKIASPSSPSRVISTARSADGKADANKFSGKYSHQVLADIGHNVPQEAPQEFTKAIIDADKGAAATISPRVGHLHVTLDDLPWRWADFSDSQTIVVNGLPPGPHKILIELADAEHRVLTGQTVTFTVPGPAR